MGLTPCVGWSITVDMFCCGICYFSLHWRYPSIPSWKYKNKYHEHNPKLQKVPSKYKETHILWAKSGELSVLFSKEMGLISLSHIWICSVVSPISFEHITYSQVDLLEVLKIEKISTKEATTDCQIQWKLLFSKLWMVWQSQGDKRVVQIQAKWASNLIQHPVSFWVTGKNRGMRPAGNCGHYTCPGTKRENTHMVWESKKIPAEQSKKASRKPGGIWVTGVVSGEKGKL